jgi:hypothetical protein
MDRARIDRRIRELALEHAAGGLGDDTYLARLKALRDARDAIAEGSETGVPAQRAIEWLRALAELIQQADAPKEKGRSGARDLRANHGGGAPHRGDPAHLGGLRAWTGARAAGCCYGAPDRI